MHMVAQRVVGAVRTTAQVRDLADEAGRRVSGSSMGLCTCAQSVNRDATCLGLHMLWVCGGGRTCVMCAHEMGFGCGSRRVCIHMYTAPVLKGCRAWPCAGGTGGLSAGQAGGI